MNLDENDISLLIETSTERGFIALFKGTTLIYYGKLPFGLQNSATLFPEIVQAFTSLELSATDLKLVMTGIGPGSYTGIRVGAIVAKTLAFALKIPLIGICSLEGFVLKEDGSFISMIDARIGGVYVQTGMRKNGFVSSLSTPKLLSNQEVLLLLKEIKTIVTPNALLLQKRFEIFTEIAKELNIIETDPCPTQLSLSGFSKFENGQYRQDQQLELLYLR